MSSATPFLSTAQDKILLSLAAAKTPGTSAARPETASDAFSGSLQAARQDLAHRAPRLQDPRVGQPEARTNGSRQTGSRQTGSRETEPHPAIKKDAPAKPAAGEQKTREPSSRPADGKKNPSQEASNDEATASRAALAKSAGSVPGETEAGLDADQLEADTSLVLEPPLAVDPLAEEDSGLAMALPAQPLLAEQSPDPAGELTPAMSPLVSGLEQPAEAEALLADEEADSRQPLNPVPGAEALLQTSGHPPQAAQVPGNLASEARPANLTDALSSATAAAPVGDKPQAEGEMPELTDEQQLLNRLANSLAGAKGEAPLANNAAQQEPRQSQVAALIQDAGRVVDSLSPAARSFTVQPQVGVPMGHPQWNQAVVNRVLWLSAQQLPSAELRLDPPELGPLQVRIQVNQDQVQVNFVSQNPTVREALDQQANRLREMFAEQGLTLEMGVSDQSFARQEQGEENNAAGSGAGGDEGAETAPATPQGQSVYLVDHYA